MDENSNVSVVEQVVEIVSSESSMASIGKSKNGGSDKQFVTINSVMDLMMKKDESSGSKHSEIGEQTNLFYEGDISIFISLFIFIILVIGSIYWAAKFKDLRPRADNEFFIFIRNPKPKENEPEDSVKAGEGGAGEGTISTPTSGKDSKTVASTSSAKSDKSVQ